MMPWFFRLSHTPSAAFRGFRGPKLPGRGRAAVGHASSHDPPTHGLGVTARADQVEGKVRQHLPSGND